MEAPFIFDWGQSVQVTMVAPKHVHPGNGGWVVGMKEIDGNRLYNVEFSDGQAVEIDEEFLEALEEE